MISHSKSKYSPKILVLANFLIEPIWCLKSNHSRFYFSGFFTWPTEVPTLRDHAGRCLHTATEADLRGLGLGFELRAIALLPFGRSSLLILFRDACVISSRSSAGQQRNVTETAAAKDPVRWREKANLWRIKTSHRGDVVTK